MTFVRWPATVAIVSTLTVFGCAEGAKYHPPDGGTSAGGQGAGGGLTGRGGLQGTGTGGAPATIGSGGSPATIDGAGGGERDGVAGRGGSPGTGENGAAGQGGNAGAPPSRPGYGGAGGNSSSPICAAPRHLCSGICADDTAAQCGSSCMACTAPIGGTALCTDGVCDFSCGPLRKCGKKCIAATDGSCCTDQDCPAQAGKAAKCDSNTNICNYACSGTTKPCGATCIASDACCTNADCAPPQTCGGGGTSNVCGDTCTAVDACHLAGTYNATTKMCSNPPAADDTICNGGMGRCLSGACVQCTSDRDCTGNTPSCDTVTHTCVCRRPSLDNLVKNPGFDAAAGLAWWMLGTTLPHTAAWNSDDADGCPGSGSAHAEDTSIEGGPSQCVPVSGNTRYFFGAKIKALSMPQPSLGVCEFLIYSDENCTTNIPGTGEGFNSGGTIGVWRAMSGSLTTPANAKGILINCLLIADNVDQIYLNPRANTY